MDTIAAPPEVTTQDVRDQLAAWIAEHGLPAPKAVIVGTTAGPYIAVDTVTLADLRAWAALLGTELEPTALLEGDQLSTWVRAIDRSTRLDGVPYPLEYLTWWPEVQPR